MRHVRFGNFGGFGFGKLRQGKQGARMQRQSTKATVRGADEAKATGATPIDRPRKNVRKTRIRKKEVRNCTLGKTPMYSISYTIGSRPECLWDAVFREWRGRRVGAEKRR
jgi:hypothetical protein